MLPFFLPGNRIVVEVSPSGNSARSGKPRRGMLRLQSRSKPLGLRDTLDLDRDRIYSRFDALEPAVYCAELTGRHGPRLQPLRDQANDRETQNYHYQSGHDPGEHFVDD